MPYRSAIPSSSSPPLKSRWGALVLHRHRHFLRFGQAPPPPKSTIAGPPLAKPTPQEPPR
jgi:hypothetical protein